MKPTLTEAKETHEKLRQTLIDSGSKEYGDCIIDDICRLFNYPTTIDVDPEDRLQNFFEKEDFQLNLFEQDGKQCADVETWTDGGVNMIITLVPFVWEKFVEYVNDFNIDEEIDLHRQDERYKNAFTVSQSVRDFKRFNKRLKKVVKKY